MISPEIKILLKEGKRDEAIILLSEILEDLTYSIDKINDKNVIGISSIDFDNKINNISVKHKVIINLKNFSLKFSLVI